MNVGIDLVKIERFKEHEKFAKKILSKYEYEFYLNSIDKVQFVASRFCLKEAFLKTLKLGIFDINLNEIEVIKEESGAIHIEYKNEIYSASLSHESEYCVGVVIHD